MSSSKYGIESPCLDCKDRRIEPDNCHDSCVLFAEYRRLMDEASKREKEASTAAANMRRMKPFRKR